MRILLISKVLHDYIAQYRTKKIEIINVEGLHLSHIQAFLNQNHPSVEGVLIADDALSLDDNANQEHLVFLLEWLSQQQRAPAPVVIITRDYSLKAFLTTLSHKYGNLKWLVCSYIRIPISMYIQGFEMLQEAKPASKSKPGKANSFLDRFKPKPKEKSRPELEATEPLTMEFASLSRAMSRVIAITGHRGSGLTSTTVNLASEASKRGLSVMVLDMDVMYRSMNMYFSSFHERTKRDEDINASLIKVLARPQDYPVMAFNIKDKLWVSSLGYGFSDRKLIEQFYHSARLISLLSMLRGKFNLVLLDMPLDQLESFKESMIHIDVFGLCVPNNLYSIISTLKNIEFILDEDATYLNAKSKVIVTKYNDRSRFQDEIFAPDKVSEVLSSGLLDTMTYEMKVAGYVPYTDEFDSQIESDVPLVMNMTEYERAYGNILLRLMEGAS